MKRILSLLLTVAMLIAMLSAFAVSATTAESTTASSAHNLYEIDGANYTKAATWANVSAMELKSNGANADRPEGSSFSGSVKVAWSAHPNNHGWAYFYVYINVKDSTKQVAYNSAQNDFITFGVGSGGTTVVPQPGGAHTAGYATYAWGQKDTELEKTYFTVTRNSEGYEAWIKATIVKSDDILFDVMVRDSFDGKGAREDFSLTGGANLPDANAPLDYYNNHAWAGTYGANGHIVEEAAFGTVIGLYEIADAGYKTSDTWASIPAQQLKSNGTNATRPEGSIFSGSVKVAWAPHASNPDLLYFYAYLDVKDSTVQKAANSANNDYVTFGVGSGYKTIVPLPGGAHTAGYATYAWAQKDTELEKTYFTVTRNSEGYEAWIKATIVKSDDILFDVMVRDGFDGKGAREDFSLTGGANLPAANAPLDYYTNHAWAGTYGVRGLISEAPVAIKTLKGASIRLDPSNQELSGIRFATTVDVDRLESMGATSYTTGTLILPTKNLAAVNGEFTLDALKASGMQEGIHYYNLVNENESGETEWVDGTVGTWFGTLFGIRDTERSFSAVGYVTVTVGGETTTYYGGYTDDCARSIAYVAARALGNENDGDGIGKWTAAQEAVLKSFIAGAEN